MNGAQEDRRLRCLELALARHPDDDAAALQLACELCLVVDLGHQAPLRITVAPLRITTDIDATTQESGGNLAGDRRDAGAYQDGLDGAGRPARRPAAGAAAESSRSARPAPCAPGLFAGKAAAPAKQRPEVRGRGSGKALPPVLSRTLRAIHSMDKGRGVSRPELARSLGVTNAAAGQRLQKLRKRGLIEMVGDKRGARWRCAGRAADKPNPKQRIPREGRSGKAREAGSGVAAVEASAVAAGGVQPAAPPRASKPPAAPAPPAVETPDETAPVVILKRSPPDEATLAAAREAAHWMSGQGYPVKTYDGGRSWTCLGMDRELTADGLIDWANGKRQAAGLPWFGPVAELVGELAGEAAP